MRLLRQACQAYGLLGQGVLILEHKKFNIIFFSVVVLITQSSKTGETVNGGAESAVYLDR